MSGESNPTHYDGDACMVAISNAGMAREFCIGNAIKYMWRLGRKPSAEEQTDLKKAEWYLDWYEKNETWVGGDDELLDELRVLVYKYLYSSSSGPFDTTVELKQLLERTVTMSTRQLAKIICDSVSPDRMVGGARHPEEGTRLTTMEVELPRIVLAEFNTHRVFSRNSASSRAIPIEKMLKRVQEDPYIPETWGKNGKGMQAKEVLNEEESKNAEFEWLQARDLAVVSAKKLLERGVHKQTTNRLLEPFMWHTIIVTATEWSNFFHLRCHPDAHPAIRRTAEAMQVALYESTPKLIQPGGWHLPLVDERDEGETIGNRVKLSSARCARISYLTHDGVREPSKDIELHDKLLQGGHMSPFEHPAMVGVHRAVGLSDPGRRSGNFAAPWVQYRKTLPYEHDIHSDPKRAGEEA